jgi:gluconolactonase
MRFLLVATLTLLGSVSAANAGAPTKVDEATIDRWDPAMDAIVPKDWKVEKLAEGFGWAEGPIWVKSGGYLLFTDVPNKM